VAVRADSVVVFNEIMYHPPVNEAAMEWVELHNQMAVNVDLSRWSLRGGVDFTFPEGTVIAGKGYLVIAASPADLMAATGLTNVLGPFTGRLSNNGETLELRNSNNRLMDEITYGVDDDWPVAPDDSGVSLAKLEEAGASDQAGNWTMSALVGGTPGRRNFVTTPYETVSTTVVQLDSTWKYEASGADPGTAWRTGSFDDGGWPSGAGLFKAGNVSVPIGDPELLPTVFSTGMDANGVVLAPGVADPHYQLTQSAQGTPPPPAIAATVIQNHPAWFGNDLLSSWIGPVNPGTENVAAGSYHYRTTFSLTGYDPASAVLTLQVGVDNRLPDLELNGVSTGITFEGFSALSGPFSLTNGFVAGNNTLDFLTVNDGDSPNPAGFRAQLSGTARKQLTAHTSLPGGRTNYYFRTQFNLSGAPELARVQLRPVIADGAVFYLNGIEVLRWNMPAGPIAANTLALSNVANPTMLGTFALPNTALLQGTNVLAVELHPAADGLADVLLGAEVELTTTNLLAPPPFPVAFNELNSTTNGEFWVELINHGTAPLDLNGCLLALRGQGGPADYVFPAQSLGAGQVLSLTQTTLGFAPQPEQRLFLYRPNGIGVLDAVVVKTPARARWPDGGGRWWFPTQLTPGASNHFEFPDAVVINEIMYHPPFLPPEPPGYGTNVLVSITNRWKYHAQGSDLGSTWRSSGYNDSAWPEGQALFYNTGSFLPAEKNTELPLTDALERRIITWYFRTSFVYPGGTNSGQLTFNPIVDDGAVYYLNGVEVHRQNMPGGAIGYATLASSGVATPTYSGPFSVPVYNLNVGTNVLAVEVHQFTTNPIAADMAFGVEVSNFGFQSPATPAVEGPDAWVELFNRSTNAVDLTGWRLDEGIDFRFAPGTVLPGNGYLVVAKDVSFMQSNYPGIAVVGPYANKLSHKSDHLVLKDANNNPADAVRYFDGGRWPANADGGGSSLELRDPWADNSKPEAWAASDESGRAQWQTYTYRGVAQNNLGPTLWHEFVLGLLDAGECLIDDLHVIEAPDTAPVELLQNGSFETGLDAWRALGNHGASQVIADPDDPGNHVLHLKATGPTGHMHNHLETTYANGKTIATGQQYEISFRAKWLAGNNRLNTRLYFNRVARTTALATPRLRGTPGVSNSTRVPNLGPTFDGLQHRPVLPAPLQPVTVTVDVFDPHGLTNVTLYWSADGGSWQTENMTFTGHASTPNYATCSGLVPGQAANTMVQFFVQATDGLGAVATFPAGGTNSRALYRVENGQPLMTQLHRLRLLLTPADVARLHASTNVMSNERTGLTVIYDENEVFYDVGMHLQGSERGRNASSRVGFTVRFNADQLFRGTQKGLVIDRSGGYSGRGGRHDEILLWHAANHAGGGLLGVECDLVQVFAPRASEDGTGLMRMQAFDNDYFESLFSGGDDGPRYMMELIYYPTTTAIPGDPQSPKLPQPDEVINVDYQDWGSDPENYRWIFSQENHADLDDYSQIVALNQAFSLSGAAFEEQMRQRTDADEWMRTLAFKTLTGDVDTFTEGLNHNWKTYFRPGDGKALGLLWDMDFAFSQNVNAGFPGNGSPNTRRFILLPDNYRRYYHHLFNLVTTTMNATHLAPWAAHYAGLLGQNWSGAVTYIQQRGNYVLSAMPAGVPFVITSNGGQNFSTTNDSVTLSGLAPIAVRDIAVNGIQRELVWTSLTNWTLTAPLPDLVNPLSLQGLDDQGQPLPGSTAFITITNLGTLPPGPVVINEWMAANTGPGGFADPLDGLFQDWFELYNPNATAVDLSGFYLTDNLSKPTKWQIPANVIIAPHGFLLVWADGDTQQNGLGNNGDLHAGFSLSQGGEEIGLYATNGGLQHAVIFGPQTSNLSQGLYPDGNTNAVHFMPDWTPRAANRLGTPAAPVVGAITVPGDGTIQFQSQVIAGRTYRLEYKDDLQAPAWTPLGGTLTAAGPTLTVTDLPGSAPKRFYRLVLLP